MSVYSRSATSEARKAGSIGETAVDGGRSFTGAVNTTTSVRTTSSWKVSSSTDTGAPSVSRDALRIGIAPGATGGGWATVTVADATRARTSQVGNGDVNGAATRTTRIDAQMRGSRPDSVSTPRRVP